MCGWELLLLVPFRDSSGDCSHCIKRRLPHSSTETQKQLVGWHPPPKQHVASRMNGSQAPKPAELSSSGEQGTVLTTSSGLPQQLAQHSSFLPLAASRAWRLRCSLWQSSCPWQPGQLHSFSFSPNYSISLSVHFLVRSQTSPAWNSSPNSTPPPNTPENRREWKGLECQNSCYKGCALSLQGRHQAPCSCLRSCLSVLFCTFKTKLRLLRPAIN